jgi:NADH-quinone oxidoreductase subunit F
VVVIYPEEICYLQVTPEDVPEIVSQTIREKKVVDRLLYVDPNTGEKATYESDIPFYKNQKRNIISSNIKIDPKTIDDYLAIDGYSALAKVLSGMSSEEVVEEVKKSNLRGRGGGGFPAGRKWEGSRNAPDKTKYVIVNADEGDPVNIAINQAEAYGFIGKNILGSGFDFKVIVHKGAGAFVCGESTALMTALEGRAGEPRPKYIRSNIKGLWSKPSVLNNVETWANVPLIINNGADWFTQFGTEKSKGTKIFSLVGKIANTGLVEVPMGMTLRDIIYDIGGGIPGGKKFKAVQTGGPSGGCIPENLLDLEVGFDEQGLRQMLKVLTNITEGNGNEGDIELLEELSEVAGDASLCALGTSAPNPFLSTVRYFRDEYEAHIKEKRCPALSCKELIAYHIEPAKCTACMICFRKCPVDAIDGAKKTIHIIDQEICTKCGTCFEVCPSRFSAVQKISGESLPPPISEEERMIIRKSKAK